MATKISKAPRSFCLIEPIAAETIGFHPAERRAIMARYQDFDYSQVTSILTLVHGFKTK